MCDISDNAQTSRVNYAFEDLRLSGMSLVIYTALDEETKWGGFVASLKTKSRFFWGALDNLRYKMK